MVWKIKKENLKRVFRQKQVMIDSWLNPTVVGSPELFALQKVLGGCKA